MTAFTPEQELFADTVFNVARDKITPLVPRMEDDDRVPPELADLYRQMGWLALLVPERFGGSEAGVTEWTLMVEQLARVSLAAVQVLESMGPIILLRYFGTEEQQARFYPRIIESTGCFAATEPEAGSDIASIRTTAVDKGGYFVVNGRKQFIGNAGEAGVIALLVTVDSRSKTKGLRILMVDRNEAAGLSVTREERKMGLRGASLGEVTLDDVEVPVSNLIAGERAFHAVQVLFDMGRPSAAGQAVGVARAATDYAINYALGRHQFGRPVFDFQGVSFTLANMAMNVEAARELTYAAAAEVDRGGPRRTELSSMAKAFATDVAMSVTTDAVQCLGAAGYTQDHPVERMMRDAKALQIFVGTNQLQRMIIARELRQQAAGASAGRDA